MFESLHQGAVVVTAIIAANKYEAKKQVDRNKLIAVFGRDDDLTKNKRDQDVSV
jgi:hypothetical protein